LTFPTKLEKNQNSLSVFTLKFDLFWNFFMVCLDFDDLIFSILFLKENQWKTKTSKINVMISPKSSPFKFPVCLRKELNPMLQRTTRQLPASSLKHWIRFWESSKIKLNIYKISFLWKTFVKTLAEQWFNCKLLHLYLLIII